MGHVVFSGGISIDPLKLAVVKDWKQPTSTTKVKSFLGLVGCYCRFIEKFSLIAELMTKLTHKNVKYIWIEDNEKAFHEITRRLTTALVLTMPITRGDFVMCTDASGIGLGYGSMQF